MIGLKRWTVINISVFVQKYKGQFSKFFQEKLKDSTISKDSTQIYADFPD